MKLYGSPIPKASSFAYLGDVFGEIIIILNTTLGVPFSPQGKIAIVLLIRRNIAFAVSAMRATLLPINVRSSSFSRLIASRLYTTFIRPKFEYGLCICTFQVKQLALLEKAQDQCLRMAFGGHRTSSTGVFKHLVNLPSMTERTTTLVFKFILRVHFLPEDILLSLLLRFVQDAPVRSRFRWPALVASNPLWSNPTLNGATYRTQNLTKIYQKQNPPVLLSACRPYHGVDPILTLPMSVYDRSRLLRWRMGWLPGRPIACRCGHSHASRAHLLSCLRVATRLNVALNTRPNPLDYVLNQLPRKIPV
ncbi:hypothetical protein BCV72DRAFT_335919 [Rhizopus microsporus var. microsporus]|uniref:Uncharacterized protein n=2 Tax=Rhizopus microsporus TaxID=58291 RepID=A0A2G4SRD9_RHIZD|nr:uncharacterized protein RHIMIDRAFT_292899 [Rhizopus microsporus ATCC 52813]ORE06461.1 hypothetical protein BCV72DRAFT_335919 [Rhizopus microsporus var. microsporus]PHZ11331.1 hypothetical protein RHIMIDRAFT_292899 [Rhizopus microsporus ATCC 52813]